MEMNTIKVEPAFPEPFREPRYTFARCTNGLTVKKPELYGSPKQKRKKRDLRVPCYLLLLKHKSRQRPSILFGDQALDHIYPEPGKTGVSVCGKRGWKEGEGNNQLIKKKGRNVADDLPWRVNSS